MKDKYTMYQLVFYRADNPPDVMVEVLCTDGVDVKPGYYDDSEEHSWRHEDASAWPEVKAWAEPPDPVECMADCYPSEKIVAAV